jgi:enamine deaminase RidA (YjgF/YER057c/UK114 family)
MTGQSLMIRFVNPPSLPRPFGSSHVTEASGSRTVYVSGQVALDRSGNMVGPGDLRAQTQQVFANLKAVLTARRYQRRDPIRWGRCIMSPCLRPY